MANSEKAMKRKKIPNKKEYSVAHNVSTYLGVGGDKAESWPVKVPSIVTSGFGPRTLRGKPNNHTGIDIAPADGETKPTIYSLPNIRGKIVVVKRINNKNDPGTGYGNFVIIETEAGNRILYGHLDSISNKIKEGKTISGGVALGRMGKTGNSTGVHLHLEFKNAFKNNNGKVTYSAVHPKKFKW